MYNSFYKKLVIHKPNTDDKMYVLSEQEINAIRKIERNAILGSALIGAAMVLLLYLPQYYFSDFFGDVNYKIPFLKIDFPFSFLSFTYGMILVFVEIVLLTFLNIYSAHYIAVATGFINESNKLDDAKSSAILGIGKEKKDKKILSLGINPYQGLSNKSVFLLNLFFTLKATLSNLLIRIFVKRVLGRYAVREVLDMLGIPIFAFWNAYATHKVLKETRLIIMGNNLVNEIKQKLPTLNLSDTEKEIVYDTLQFVAMNKRDFHNNHYYLSKNVLEFYGIVLKQQHVCPPNYISLLNQQSEAIKKLCSFILVCGFVLDGQISMREKNKIKKLNGLGFFTDDAEQVESYCKNFINGKGIEELEKEYL